MIKKPSSSLSRLVLLLILSATVTALVLVASAPSHAKPRSALMPGGPDSASGFVADKGKFRIMVSGQQVGKEEFEIAPSGNHWVAHGTSEIQAAKGSSRITGTLSLKPDGTPTEYEWSTEGAKSFRCDCLQRC